MFFFSTAARCVGWCIPAFVHERVSKIASGGYSSVSGGTSESQIPSSDREMQEYY